MNKNQHIIKYCFYSEQFIEIINANQCQRIHVTLLIAGKLLHNIITLVLYSVFLMFISHLQFQPWHVYSHCESEQ